MTIFCWYATALVVVVRHDDSDDAQGPNARYNKLSEPKYKSKSRRRPRTAAIEPNGQDQKNKKQTEPNKLLVDYTSS
jgi:hypothetical protein